MTDPATLEDLHRLIQENCHFSGTSPNVQVHAACPFCGAPDFWCHPLLETEKALEDGTVCGQCGRGMRALVTRSADGNEVRMRMVQTCGDDPPPYLSKIDREPPP